MQAKNDKELSQTNGTKYSRAICPYLLFRNVASQLPDGT